MQQSSSKMAVQRNTRLTQETRKYQINYLTVDLKKPEEKEQMKSKVSRRRK